MSEDAPAAASIGPLDIGRIMAALPHRYPMLLVDRVEELVVDERIVTVALILILAVISVTAHMRIGMQVIIEDYVHDKTLKILSLLANNFYAVIVAVACLYAILRVSLARLV